MFGFFCLETLKNCILNENITHRWPQSRHFFPQIRALFSNIWKTAGETSPLPPSSDAPVASLDQKIEGKCTYFTWGGKWEEFGYVHAEKKVTLSWLINLNIVRPEKSDHFHLVYHFTVPLREQKWHMSGVWQNAVGEKWHNVFIFTRAFGTSKRLHQRELWK